MAMKIRVTARLVLLALLASCSDSTGPVRHTRPTQVLPIPHPVRGAAYDAIRGRVYLATSVDSPIVSTPAIGVVRLTPPSLLPGILLSWSPHGLDLTASGDSLLVVGNDSAGRPRLGIINLTTLVKDSVDTIAFTPALYRYPIRVRAMVNNHAFVGVSGSYPGSNPGELVAIDLGTLGQTLRTDAGSSGNIGRAPQLARSRDGRRLLVFSSSSAADEGQVYETGTDSLGVSVAVQVPRVELPAIGGLGVSADSSGSLWLVGNRLLASDLSPVRIFGGSQGETLPSVLTDDGRFAYIAESLAVAKFRTADGVKLEEILLPHTPYELLVSRDGTTLIAIGAGGVMVVDLR